jgi:thiamine biosynthesis lipoprotein
MTAVLVYVGLGWGCVAQAAAGAGTPDANLTRFEFRQVHMGTEFNLVIYTATEQDARRASAKAFERVAALDATLSDYNPESELMRLCDRAGGPPVPVSPDLYRNLDAALTMSRLSDGAFDPTVNPVVRLWRRARRERVLPAADDLARARALVDYRDLVLDPEARTARLRRPGMKLDLGGVAKGDASTQALAALRECGVTVALAAVAGDIVVGDPPPGQVGWSVSVAPLEPGAPSPTLLLANAAVSTSGDAERFVEIDGKRYAHIVDPRTGLGVIDRASVTVVAPDGPTADSLATTVYALGPTRGLPLVDSVPGAACYVVRKEGDSIREHRSARWDAIPQRRPDDAAGGVAPAVAPRDKIAP